jgi:DNA-binding transcriptional LysR family regulator
MELLQLKYFKKIAETENMTRVSKEIHISQSALSKTIRILETELGVKLFNREGKYIKLNKNGKIFLKYVNRSLQSLEDAKKELDDCNNNAEQDICIYVQAAMFMLPKIITGFNQIYPNIKFHISQKQFNKSENNYDFILYIPSPEEINEKNSMTLLEEELKLAVSKNNYLAEKADINLSSLFNEKFIGLPSYTKLRKTTDHYCKLAGFTPDVILECYDSPTILELVKSGMGIAFVPKYSWGNIEHQELSLINIHSPKCTRCINLYWSESEYISESAKLFKNYIIEFFSNFNKP